MRSRIRVVLFFVFIISLAIFSGTAEAQQTCIQKQMSCTSACDSRSPDYARCVERCNDRLVSCANTTKADCLSTYSACNLGCKGDNILPCLQQCANRNNVCTTAERAARRAEKDRRYESRRQPPPTYTPPPPTTQSNTGSGYTGPSESPSSVADILGGIRGEPIQSEGSQTPSKNLDEDIRKKLGTDLATMRAVSDVGTRNAIACAVLEINDRGRSQVRNLCGKSINFGYCYSDWVHARGLSNPIKCDLTGKPSWGAASSVKGSGTTLLAGQDNASKGRTHIGPCMSEIVHNNRTYIYLHSKRTTTGPFDGVGGKYTCMYLKAAGQD